MQGRWVLGGGIGSGKSRVREILARLGVPTIDADSVGHQVLEPEGPAFAEVSSRWPEVVVDGRIDRSRLGSIVFGDPGQLAELEAMTHPHIFRTIGEQAAEIRGGVVVEMPLLGRLPGSEWRLLVVDARDELRVERAVGRGMNQEDVRARMASQPSRGQWLAAADAVIPNHGSFEDLESTVNRLLPSL
jgi:dephospho-CoA kinase